MALVLASQSPRRRELMALITPSFTACVAAFDEAALSAGSPAALAGLLAKGKALATAADWPGDVVIGCDTVVELDGRVLGKPHSREEAVQMLTALSGRRHAVHTGVCVVLPDFERVEFVETSHVAFDAIPPAEIEAYVDTEEPYDKAGGYGIQGWAARFIPHIEGCYYNVMGLPVAALYKTLRELGALAP